MPARHYKLASAQGRNILEISSQTANIMAQPATASNNRKPVWITPGPTVSTMGLHCPGRSGGNSKAKFNDLAIGGGAELAPTFHKNAPFLEQDGSLIG